MKNREYVIVLGMHRSGTSLVTNIIANAGYFAGGENDLIQPAADNPKGFYENIGIVAVNDNILKMCHGSWDNPPHESTIENLHINSEQSMMDSIFKDHKKVVIKDPRMCLTIPVWKDVLPENIKIVYITRRKEAVTASLAHRNSFSEAKSNELYNIYNQRAEKYAKNFPALKIEYEDLFSTKRDESLGKLKTFLESDKDLIEIGRHVIDPNLNHFDSKQYNQFVSIVIPVFNKLEYTKKCIDALLKNTHHPTYEIIIVNNASTDDTFEYLEELKKKHQKIRVIHNESNFGFVDANNQAAKIAVGDYLFCLNNDTEVRESWLTPLVEFANDHPDCAVIGSKLVYPDNTLQEAGGIIFSDGNGWNYGRGQNPDDARYNYVREVDYCSGAAILVRKVFWDEIEGFDTRFAPAYYEDTDLCFNARKEGYKVYYHPYSVVTHYEGKTAGTDLNSGFKKFQIINRQKFLNKWRTELQNQKENNAANVISASERNARKNILIIDPFLPMFDRASGSFRLLQIIKSLKKMNYHITFIARNEMHADVYQPMLEKLGVMCIVYDVSAMAAAGVAQKGRKANINYKILFRERTYDYAILDFWYLATYYLPLIRESSPATKIIIDSVDIHYVREIREAELKKDKVLITRAKNKKVREVAIYEKADYLWVVTDTDKATIQKEVKKTPVDIVPNIHPNIDFERQFEKTRDLLFVGNFNHPPNKDAVEYFCGEVLPEITQNIPDIQLQIVGNAADRLVSHLASPSVTVTGFQKDLSPFLKSARVSISPLRYGAGMKGKIGEAFSWGIPVVTSSIGAEGMKIVDGEHALIADTTHELAMQVVNLYQSKELWSRLSINGKEHVKKNWSPEAVHKKLVRIFENISRFSTETPLVSIIMLTFNALEYTQKCVRSIQEHTVYPHEIIFVDNASSDGTQKYLQDLVQKNDHYHLIRNKQNKGFAAGNNQGVATANSNYVLLLNNDVLVGDGWLESLVSAFEKSKKIGVVGPITNQASGRQMLKDVPYSNEEDFFEFSDKIRTLNKGKITPRRRIAGLAMLMSKELYETVGGFDEAFGLGNFEDDDLCLKIRGGGFAIMVDESVYIHHFGSSTFKANKMNYAKSLKEKGRKFFKKWPKVNYNELLELENPLDIVLPEDMEMATQELIKGNIKMALNKFQSVLELDPLSADALLGTILCFRKKGDTRNALEQITELLGIYPGHAGALNQSSIIASEVGDLLGAEKLLIAANANDPDYIEAKRNLAEVKIGLGKFNEGLQIFLEIVEKSPNDIPTLLRLAEIASDAGKLEDSEFFASRVLELSPGNPGALEFVQAQEQPAGVNGI